MEQKHILKSRTFWFNLLTGVSTILALPVLPPPIIPYIPLAQALVNIGLRWVTTQPVSINPTH